KELQEQLTELRKKIQQLSKTNWGASVDSELALVREKTYQLEGWLPNRYFLGFYGKKIKNMPQLSLLVSRLDGPTPAIVRRIIDDSIYAEEQGLPGKAYFDARWSEKILQGKNRKLSAYQLYDRAIHNTARMIQKSKKLPVVLDDQAKLFVPGEAPGAALYCGWYSRARYVDAFTWARGALGYHVASSECATLKAPGSTVWCKVMLEKGVAATLGPVTEPYLQSFPAPEIFFGSLLQGKLTLAECFGLANPFWSWQQVLIGDPLYRPFIRQGFPATNRQYVGWTK
ncbi:MAG: TIGR03790 family protein, partial [Smithellaceae bacterium]